MKHNALSGNFCIDKFLGDGLRSHQGISARNRILRDNLIPGRKYSKLCWIPIIKRTAFESKTRMLKRREHEEKLLAQDFDDAGTEALELVQAADSGESSSETESDAALDTEEKADSDEEPEDPQVKNFVNSKKKVMILACRGINAR